MTKQRKESLESWVRGNMWNLLVTIVMIVSASSLLMYRVDAVEKKIASYPSYDYFELKFRTLDVQLKELNDKLEFHIQKQ